MVMGANESPMEIDSAFGGGPAAENTPPRHEQEQRREPCAAEKGREENPRRSEASSARRVEGVAIQMSLRNAVRGGGTSAMAQTADLSRACFSFGRRPPARRRFPSSVPMLTSLAVLAFLAISTNLSS